MSVDGRNTVLFESGSTALLICIVRQTWTGAIDLGNEEQRSKAMVVGGLAEQRLWTSGSSLAFLKGPIYIHDMSRADTYKIL